MYSRLFDIKNKSTASDGDVIYTTSLSTDSAEKFTKLKDDISHIPGDGIVNVTTYEHNDKYDPIFKLIVNTTSEQKHNQIKSVLESYAEE